MAEERFWMKVLPVPPGDCLIWTGAENSYGYGSFRAGRRPMLAHRLAWQMKNGPIPDGMCVLHHCDEPACVNANHLFLATRTEKNQTRVTMAERFWEKVVHASPGDCLIWTGAKNQGGYGVIGISGRRAILAHRASWIIHFGDIPNGLCVLHRCDIRDCVNPDHLFLGTYLDNNNDMIEKGRRRNVCGTDHPRAKLTNDDVRAIRKLRSEGALYRELSSQFNVGITAIRNLLIGKTWKAIGDIDDVNF